MKTFLRSSHRRPASSSRAAAPVNRVATPQASSIRTLLRAPAGAQRQCAGCEDEVQRLPNKTAPVTGDASSAVASGTAGGGAPLSSGLRHFFEPRFGQDLSTVRLHTDDKAAASAETLNARAYTLGNDIVFGAGAYTPESSTGRRLLAHELTHVLQQRGPAGAAAIQRTPRVANMDWLVSHGDVAMGNDIDLLTVAIRDLGMSAAGARQQAQNAAGRTQWGAKRDLYVKAFDFLRDNHGRRFDVPDTLDLVQRVFDFCDASSATATALNDAFYSNLLVTTVYSAGAGTATFTHISGTTYNVPGRPAGSTDFAPSGDNSLMRPNPLPGRTAGTGPNATVTGGFSATTDLLVAYGAQQGSVAASSVALMLRPYRSNIPSRLRPLIETLATDPTIFSVLQRFLRDDNGGFHLQRVGYGGAHYTPGQPVSIEVDPDLFPGSGAQREMTEINLRATLAHELYHYALDRADAALTEVGSEQDHRLISIVQDRYTIVALLRAGQSPISDDIDALNGYVGSDPKPSLTRFVTRNDQSGLRSYVQTQDFLDSTVYTMLISAVSMNANRIAGTIGNVADSLLDPSQITDLGYLAAINGVLLRRVFMLAADVAGRTRTPLASVWSHADFQTEVRSLISRYIGLASQNRTQGAAALAAGI